MILSHASLSVWLNFKHCWKFLINETKPYSILNIHMPILYYKQWFGFHITINKMAVMTPNVAVDELLLRFQEVPASDLGPDIGYLDWRYSWFFSVLQEISGITHSFYFADEFMMFTNNLCLQMALCTVNGTTTIYIKFQQLYANPLLLLRNFYY
jgi:hypothetical protein